MISSKIISSLLSSDLSNVVEKIQNKERINNEEGFDSLQWLLFHC